MQALRLQVCLDLDRAMGAVRPDRLAGVGESEHIVRLLTVVHGRVRRIPFGQQQNSMGGKIVRTIGIVRARFKIGMMNLGYNIRRLVQLERMAAAPA